MKIVNVIPISKESLHENLSYFTSKEIEVGALVTVPIRKKIAPAIVVSVADAKDAKTALKKSEFGLKPIKTIKSQSFLRPEFVEACKKIAKYFVSSTGTVIRDFIPATILGSVKFEEASPPKEEKPHDNKLELRDPVDLAIPGGNRHEILLMQAPQQDRFQYYKSVIREEFAKNRSVFFLLPTTNEIDEFSKELQRGIEMYTICLHSKISKRKIQEMWNTAIKENHPLLIIATKSFLSLPRKDIGVFILDCENSPLYKLQQKPYVDIRKAMEIISKEMKIKLIVGDSLIRTETFHGRNFNTAQPPSRMLSEAEQFAIDMKKEISDPSNWQKANTLYIFSNQLKKIFKEANENNEKVILFVNRRGYSPTTFCQDCQKTILCDKCDTPLVLHKEILSPHKERVVPDGTTRSSLTKWHCHKCLAKIDAPEQCPYCKSWRLQTMGIGIQLVAEEIKKILPKSKVFTIDSDSIKNTKVGQKTASEFLAGPGILIGTEMLLSYINHPVERVAVVSLDAMFSLPDFRVNEKILHLLLKLRGLAKKTFLIQTRLAEQNVFNDAIRGNVSGFYKTEIENRRQFDYPPFKLIIKLFREGKNKLQIKQEAQMLEKILTEWNPISYAPFVPKIKNVFGWNILLKIDPASWPEGQQKLYGILSSLPSMWKTDIEPESLL